MSVANKIVDRLRKRYVRWPSPQEQRDIMRSWELEKALRKVIGGIDGSHIKIPGPDEELLLAYYNYKKFYSIVLFAVVDNVGRFRWFCSGCPGSCGDSGVLQATSFYKLAQEELSKPVEERKIFADGSCILGDSAFAEGPWMRTPITLPQERAERYFNYKHSSMRMRLEHAFGRLKWKFLATQRGLLFKLEHAPIIIDACVILYNFILDHEGTWSLHVHIDDAQTRGGTGRAPGETSAGREAEVAYLRDAGFLQEEWGDPGSRADRRRADRERRFRGQEEVPPVDML